MEQSTLDKRMNCLVGFSKQLIKMNRQFESGNYFFKDYEIIYQISVRRINKK